MIRSGTLLLAQPYLLDPNFKRATVGIVDHHEDGTVGFVLNHPLDWKITDVMNGFPSFDAFMNFGGPVQRDTLHFVHTLGEMLHDSIHVRENLYWGGDFEQLTELIASDVADPSNVKFFLGYSGWSPGQLEAEMKEETWVTSAFTSDLLFDTPSDQIWPKAMNRLGNTFGVIGQMDEESLN